MTILPFRRTYGCYTYSCVLLTSILLDSNDIDTKNWYENDCQLNLFISLIIVCLEDTQLNQLKLGFFVPMQVAIGLEKPNCLIHLVNRLSKSIGQ